MHWYNWSKCDRGIQVIDIPVNRIGSPHFVLFCGLCRPLNQTLREDVEEDSRLFVFYHLLSSARYRRYASNDPL